VRRCLLLIILAVTGFTGVACTPPNRTSITSDVADPDVAWDGARYVLHSTNTPYGNVPTWTSTDLGKWTFTGDALPTLPSWAQPGWTWAPSAMRRPDGMWFLFFSAAVRGRTTSFGQPLKCIGAASGPTAKGPFKVLPQWNTAPLLCQSALGGDIDPSTFRNPANGLNYLVTKVDGNGSGRPTQIENRRLNPNLGSFQAGMGPTVLLRSTIGTWEKQVIEGPDLVSASGRLHLLYSGGDFAANSYGEGQSLCASTGSACVRNGRVLNNPGYGNGAGGASAFTSRTGAPLLAWHAYLDPNSRQRSLLLGTLASSPAGALSISGSPVPAGSVSAPASRAAGIPTSVDLEVPAGTRVTVPNAHTR
jgi:hypothetical protein